MAIRRFSTNRLHQTCTTRPALLASKALDSKCQILGPTTRLLTWEGEMQSAAERLPGLSLEISRNAHHWDGTIEHGGCIHKTAHGSFSEGEMICSSTYRYTRLERRITCAVIGADQGNQDSESQLEANEHLLWNHNRLQTVDRSQKDPVLFPSREKVTL